MSLLYFEQHNWEIEFLPGAHEGTVSLVSIPAATEANGPAHTISDLQQNKHQILGVFLLFFFYFGGFTS